MADKMIFKGYFLKKRLVVRLRIRIGMRFINFEISKALSSKKATLESHEIFDFVEAELVPQSDKASPRCPSQYWRVGSSPISRTSVKDIRFSSVLYFYS